MKTRTILRLLVLGTALSLACGVAALKAQDAPPAPEPIKLTGSAVKTENIVLNCDAVFVGEISDPGNPSGAADAAWVVYSGVSVKLVENLRSSVESQVKITLSTLHDSSLQETPPTFENSYIFFVNKTDSGDDAYKAVKILPATDENIAKVKQLIAAAPAIP